jgi:hypothetical protein
LVAQNIVNISIFIHIEYEPQCISGKNCLIKQSQCIADICEYNKGYKTLSFKSTPIDQQIYCNYKQISQYIPMITEFFLPIVSDIL